MAPQTMAVLHRRVLELGQSLESRGQSALHLAAYRAAPAGWQRTNDGRYAAWAAAQEMDTQGSEGDDAVRENGHWRPQPGADDQEETTVIMPVRGLNIPFADVALAEGDTVFVERLTPRWISVLGLVNTPGNFAYPPETEYRLADALALAGGLNLVAEPRYVCVYRLRADGQVIGATFQLVDKEQQESLTQELALKVKPGDVISVEHTPRTRSNLFFERVFRLSLGLLIDPMDFIDDGE
jgi:hypothetical protein